MPALSTNFFVAVFELILILAGAALLWRHALRPAARAGLTAANSPLPRWQIPVSEFLLFALVIIAGSLATSFLSGLIVNPLNIPADTKTIINSAAFQIGLLIGPAILPLQLGHHPFRSIVSRSTLLSGVTTFLIALPVVTLVNLAWMAILKASGLPAEQQDLLRMFSEAQSPALLTLLIGLATLVAPLTEELLFRATLFRYVRTRLPRWMALLIPGIIFAMLHVNWMNLDGLASFAPLVTLAIVFSLAYERTGRIGTAIVAHALFNLHTILILFTGSSE
jgi:membrane protease YdiL (CAAX protease family)